MTTAQMARYLDKTASYALPNGLTFWVSIVIAELAVLVEFGYLTDDDARIILDCEDLA